MPINPLEVRQPVALDKTYAPSAPRLFGRDVEVRPGGVDRTTHPLSKFERICARASNNLSRIKDKFVNDDSTADRRAVRFNAQHEQFSGDVHSLVGQLKAGNGTKAGDHSVLATLRNSARLMHRDQKLAGKDQILNARLDVELSGCSDHELATVKQTLSDIDRSGLSANDRLMLDKMLTAVVKHELSRSPATLALLHEVRDIDLSQGDSINHLNASLHALKQSTAGALQTSGVPGHREVAPTLVGDILKLRLQSEAPGRDELRTLNQNMLNVHQKLQNVNPSGRGAYDIGKEHPLLRDFGRAIRGEFLKTGAQVFTDANQLTRNVRVGAGALHVVTKATYEVGGFPSEKVHKFDDSQIDGYDHFYAPPKQKISRGDPRLLERAVFSSKLDEHLGFNVTVKTDFAVHRDEIGIVMDKAPGKTAHSVGGRITNLNDKVLQRELVKLQLLDAILGQGDRHGGNYMVDTAPDGSVRGVKGIDSDFCMGLNPDMSVLNTLPSVVHLPPIIDREMYDKIMALTPDQLETMSDGMFSTEALDAAKARLVIVQQHCQDLHDTGKIVDPTDPLAVYKDWGTENVNKVMKESKVNIPGTKSNTSYWQRDQRHFDQPSFGFA